MAPTETVYGLAADATNSEAVAKIFALKARPSFNPLICHVADLAMAERFAHFDPLSRKLAETFWPGPLTLILALTPDNSIHSLACAGLPTVGVRVPQGFLRDLSARVDRPLAAPSANRSGSISPTQAQHVQDDFKTSTPLLIDGGPASVGLESTILKVEDGVPVLLRPGGLSVEELEAVAGCTIDAAKEREIEAPGMMLSHYAPRARLRMDADSVEPGEVLIAFGPERVNGAGRCQGVVQLSETANMHEAAARLFAALHEADGFDAPIAVEPVPDHDLGLAINDRLRRAAAPR